MLTKNQSGECASLNQGHKLACVKYKRSCRSIYGKNTITENVCLSVFFCGVCVSVSDWALIIIQNCGSNEKFYNYIIAPLVINPGFWKAEFNFKGPHQALIITTFVRSVFMNQP